MEKADAESVLSKKNFCDLLQKQMETCMKTSRLSIETMDILKLGAKTLCAAAADFEKKGFRSERAVQLVERVRKLLFGDRKPFDEILCVGMKLEYGFNRSNFSSYYDSDFSNYYDLMIEFEHGPSGKLFGVSCRTYEKPALVWRGPLPDPCVSGVGIVHPYGYSCTSEVAYGCDVAKVREFVAEYARRGFEMPSEKQDDTQYLVYEALNEHGGWSTGPSYEMPERKSSLFWKEREWDIL